MNGGNYRTVPNFDFGCFSNMPNHLHGIIVLNDVVGATLAVPPESVAQMPGTNDNRAQVLDGGNRRG